MQSSLFFTLSACPVFFLSVFLRKKIIHALSGFLSVHLFYYAKYSCFSIVVRLLFYLYVFHLGFKDL